MRLVKLVSAIAAGLVLTAVTAQASTINFVTGDGGDVLNHSVTPGAITDLTALGDLHNVWGDISPFAGMSANAAHWISYKDTGTNTAGTVNGAPNVTDTNGNGTRDVGEETALFTRTFDVSGTGDFNLWILADDTATVILKRADGTDTRSLFTAVQGQVDPCAPGGKGMAIGCVNADRGMVHDTLTSGLWVLEVYTFQTHNDVFGIQYAGSYTQADDPPPTVPEPTSMVLLGTGLVGLASRLRRKNA